jgi:DASS family divalent anion:Na+ symporter
MKQKSTTTKLILALVTVAVGVIIAFIPPPGELTQAAMIYMGIFVSMVLLMIFELVPMHVAIILTVLSLIVFKVAPEKEVMATYGSTTVWFVVFVLGFGAAVTNSGLMKRVAYNIMRLFPTTFKGQVQSLMVASAILSPMVPSGLAKVSILAPFTTAIGKEFGYENSSKGAAGLFCAMFVPASAFGVIFLTGSLGYPTMMGFMKDMSFSFVDWLAQTWGYGVVLLILSYLFIVWFYNPARAKGTAQEKAAAKAAEKARKAEAKGSKKSNEFVMTKLAELGPMSFKEKVTAAIMIITVLLWITEPFHGFSTMVTTGCALIAFSIFGLLSPAEFTTKIAWPTVVIMGGVMTLSSLLGNLGISAWLTSVLSPVAGPLASNIFILVIAICVIVYLLRFLIISQTVCLAIIFALFGPLCIAADISIFVPIWLAFISTMVWNLPFHNSVYLAADGALGNEKMIVHKDVVSMSYAFMVINIVGNLALIPIWAMLGLV